MNHLALPAPKVEAATSKGFIEDDAAVVTDRAPTVEPGTAERAPPVEAATMYDGGFDHGKSMDAPQENEFSVSALRGSRGSSFESTVALLRGAPRKSFLKKFFPLCFDERDFVAFGEVKRFVLIKGNCCFVFMDEDDMEPLYAIPLDEVRPIMEDPKKPDKASVSISPTFHNAVSPDLVTVLLKYLNGMHAYQFTFDTSKDRSVAKRFFDVVEHASKIDGKNVTVSCIQANALGKLAAEFQPEKEIM